MESRQWYRLADKTLQFIAVAKENGFCLELLANIQHRLFKLSPFKKHKGGKT